MRVPRLGEPGLSGYGRPPYARPPLLQTRTSLVCCTYFLGRRGVPLNSRAPPPAAPSYCRAPPPGSPTPPRVCPRPRTPPPTPPQRRPGRLPDPRGPPQPRASPLTWPRAPGPPSLGDQSRSPGPSRRHLVPTPSALRLRSASRTCDLKGAGQHPSRAAGQNSTDADASPLKDQRASPP